MKYRFNVHVGDIIGQQYDFIAMDFIQVLSFHILRTDKTGLKQTGNERTSTCKRVKDMHVLSGQRSVELRFEYVIHGLDNEVHAFYGCIDNAQLFHGKRKSTFEKLFI